MSDSVGCTIAWNMGWSAYLRGSHYDEMPNDLTEVEQELWREGFDAACAADNEDISPEDMSLF